jgi:CheY-like chemotaxis protein
MLADFQRRHSIKSFSLLVIENNADHQLLIGYSIRCSMPFGQPVLATSADEALHYLDATNGVHPSFPTLVLMDIYLPDPEQGWYALREIKERYPCLPVLVLSSRYEPAFIEQVYESGANSYLRKPATLEEWEAHFQSIHTYWLGTATLPFHYAL